MKGQGEVCPQGAEVPTQRPREGGQGLKRACMRGLRPCWELKLTAQTLLLPESTAVSGPLEWHSHICDLPVQATVKVLESQLAQTNTAASGSYSDHYHSHKKSCTDIQSMQCFPHKIKLSS